MATPYSTGPAHLFVGQTSITAVSNGVVTATIINGPVYVGTSKKAPRIEIKDNWEPVFNDVTGNVPLDVAYAGEEAFISYDLTRWNESAIASLDAGPRPFVGTRGIVGPAQMGTLMVTEGRVPTVWVQFPNNTKAPYAAAGMPAGYRFFAANYEGPRSLEDLGTRAFTRHILFHALQIYTPSGYMVLYDTNMTGLPSPN